MPKVISSGVREVVLSVKEFFKKEKQIDGPAIPFKKVHERVAAATGVSLHTVSNIVKEGRLAEISGNKMMPTVKIKKTRKDKIVLDDTELEVLKKKIHEFYSTKNEIPSIRKLHNILKEEVGFKASREILRQHMKKIGIQFKNTNIQRSTSQIQIQNKLETKEICLPENMSANIHKPTLVIAENLPEQNAVNKAPNTNSRKNDIMDWLTVHRYEYHPEMTKTQLLEIVKRIRMEPVYNVNAILGA